MRPYRSRSNAFLVDFEYRKDDGIGGMNPTVVYSTIFSVHNA